MASCARPAGRVAVAGITGLLLSVDERVRGCFGYGAAVAIALLLGGLLTAAALIVVVVALLGAAFGAR